MEGWREGEKVSDWVPPREEKSKRIKERDGIQAIFYVRKKKKKKKSVIKDIDTRVKSEVDAMCHQTKKKTEMKSLITN